MIFEFLIPRRPLSLQARRPSLQAWKGFVKAEAARTWQGPLIASGDLQLTLVYLCDEAPPDIDNIIKPIQDALVGLVFADDAQISDVDSHRRFLDETFDVTKMPAALIAGIASQQECVFVRVRPAGSLEDHV